MNFKPTFKISLILIIILVVIKGGFFVTGVIVAKIDEKNFTKLSYHVIELAKEWWSIPTEQGGGGGNTVTEMIDRYIASIEDSDVLTSIKSDIEAGVLYHSFIAVTPEWNNLLKYVNSNIKPPSTIPSEEYRYRVGNEHGILGVVLDRDNPDFLTFVGAKNSFFNIYNFTITQTINPLDNDSELILNITKSKI